MLMIERDSDAEARLRAILQKQDTAWTPDSTQRLLDAIAKRKREHVIDELFERLDKHYKSK